MKFRGVHQSKLLLTKVDVKNLLKITGSHWDFIYLDGSYFKHSSLLFTSFVHHQKTKVVPLRGSWEHRHQFEYKLLLIGLIPLPFPEVETQESASAVPAAVLYLSSKAWPMTESLDRTHCSLACLSLASAFASALDVLLIYSQLCVCVRTFEVESQFGWREVWLVVTCESGDIERDKCKSSNPLRASCRRTEEQRFWCTKRRVILSLLNLIDCAGVLCDDDDDSLRNDPLVGAELHRRLS